MKKFKKINVFYIVTICVCFAVDVALLVLFLFYPRFFGAAEKGETGYATVLFAEEREDGLFVTARTTGEEEKELSFTLEPGAVVGDPARVKEGDAIAYALKQGDDSRAVGLALTEERYDVGTLDKLNEEANAKALPLRITSLCAVVVLFFAAGFCLLKFCGLFQKRKF